MGNALITRRGGGKPEGLYAWKKNSYSPAVSLENPTFDYISATVSSSSSDYTFGNFSFDISIIDDWKKFFTGFVNTNGYGSNFPSYGVFHNYSDNGNWNYTVSEVNLSEGTVTIHIGGYCGDYKSDGTYKYTGTKVVSEEIKEFLDYIVSDKETAYPDGGEKGGYWYERVAEGTKVAYGSVNPTGDLTKLVINHGLGKEPTLVIGYCESNITSIFNYDFIVEGVTAKIKYNDNIYTRTATNVDINTMEIPKTTANWGGYNYRWIAIAE